MAGVADHVANGDAQTVGERGVEAGAGWRALDDSGIDVPVFGDAECTWADETQGVGQVLAKRPTVRHTVVVDDADLIVAEAIDAVFVEEEARVLDQEVAHLGLAEIEDQPTGMPMLEKYSE